MLVISSMRSNSLLNWASHCFQLSSMLKGVCIVSTYKGQNLFSKAITIATLSGWINSKAIDLEMYNTRTLRITQHWNLHSWLTKHTSLEWCSLLIKTKGKCSRSCTLWVTKSSFLRNCQIKWRWLCNKVLEKLISRTN